MLQDLLLSCLKTSSVFPIDRFPHFSLGEVGHAQWTSSCGKIAVETSKQFSVAMLGPTPLKRTAKSAAYLTKDY